MPSMESSSTEERYYVQSETVRREGRVHYIVDRGVTGRNFAHRTVSPPYRSKKQAEEKCAAMNAAIQSKQE